VYRYPPSSLFDRLVGMKHFSDGSLEMFHCVLCHLAWTADSQVFYMANPSLGGVEALGRHDKFAIPGQVVALDIANYEDGRVESQFDIAARSQHDKGKTPSVATDWG
jgi:hypothetical protein